MPEKRKWYIAAGVKKLRVRHLRYHKKLGALHTKCGKPIGRATAGHHSLRPCAVCLREEKLENYNADTQAVVHGDRISNVGQRHHRVSDRETGAMIVGWRQPTAPLWFKAVVVVSVTAIWVLVALAVLSVW